MKTTEEKQVEQVLQTSRTMKENLISVRDLFTSKMTNMLSTDVYKQRIKVKKRM